MFELTGYPERVLMGRDLREAFGMHGFPEGKDPVAIMLEWGVRQLDLHILIRHSVGHDKAVRCDLFPAYDEDGGLLCSLAPLLATEVHPGDT